MNAYSELFRNKPMVLIMSLPVNDATICRAAFEAGADAVKVHINLHHNAGGETLGDYYYNRQTFETMLAEARGPMGIVPGASAPAIMKDAEKVKQSGFDFISFYTKHMPVSALPFRQEFMAACDKDYTTGEIESCERMGASVIEASIIPYEEYGTALNFRDVARYGAIARATSLPVVVPTQRFIAPGDVRFLHAAGVRGIMIGAVVTGKTLEGISSAVKYFREAIDNL